MQISFKKESEKLESFQLRDMIFVGKSTKISFEKGAIRIFQGIEQKLLNKIVNLEQNIQFLKNEYDFERVQASIFSDGTIFVIEREHRSKDPSKSHPDKPDPFSLFMRSYFEPASYTPIHDKSSYKPSNHESGPSKQERKKVPVLVR